jgi:hypothetical protein
MKLNKWITFASAAAMLAGVGACKDNTGGRAGSTTTSSGSTSPEGRRGANLPRSTGMDAGADVNTRSGAPIGGPASGSSSDTSTSPGSTGSTSGSATGTSGSSSSPSGSSSNPR